jgi:hypothetical protein
MEIYRAVRMVRPDTIDLTHNGLHTQEALQKRLSFCAGSESSIYYTFLNFFRKRSVLSDAASG